MLANEKKKRKNQTNARVKCALLHFIAKIPCNPGNPLQLELTRSYICVMIERIRKLKYESNI